MLDEIPKREYPYNHTHHTKVVSRESFFSFKNFGILCSLVIVGVTSYFIWTRVIDLFKESSRVPTLLDLKNQALSLVSSSPVKSPEAATPKAETLVKTETPVTGLQTPANNQDTVKAAIQDIQAVQAAQVVLPTEVQTSSAVAAAPAATSVPAVVPVAAQPTVAGQPVVASNVQPAMQPVVQPVGQPIAQPAVAPVLPSALPKADQQQAAAPVPAPVVVETISATSATSVTVTPASAQPSVQPSITADQKQDLQAAATQTPAVVVSTPAVAEVAQLQNSVGKTDLPAPILTQTNATAAAPQSAIQTAENTSANQATASSSADPQSANTATAESGKNNPALKNDSTKTREPFPKPKQPQSKNAAKSNNTTAKNAVKKTSPAAKAKTVVSSAQKTAEPVKVVLKFQLGKAAQHAKVVPIAHKQVVSHQASTAGTVTQDYADSWNKTYQAAGKQMQASSAQTVKKPNIQASASATSKMQPSSPVAQATAAERGKIKADHYAVQILAMHDEAKVKSLINSKHFKGQARYFRTLRNEQPWYVLVYGDFEEFDDARTAMNRLPSEFQKYRPWVRRYASIREAMLKK